MKKANKFSKKHRDYKYSDKKRGLNYEYTLEQAVALLQLPCYYCTSAEEGEIRGLDRIDNSLGHEQKNCIVSCYKCNMILGNLPFKVKMELREGLRSAYEKGYLKDWVPVPDQKKIKKNEEEVDFDIKRYGF